MMESFCGDCGCKEGSLHNYFPNCDMEVCPVCTHQLLSCGCDKKNILDVDREPYFQTVFGCERCGEIMPDMKMVSELAWSMTCGKTYNPKCILCIKCMDFIKEKRIDTNVFCY